MLACVDRGSRTLRAVEAAGKLRRQRARAARPPISPSPSAARRRPIEKWDGVGWSEGEGAIPILDDAIVWIGCELRDVISGGDHVIVTGEVRAIEERPGGPLLFHEGTYRPL